MANECSFEIGRISVLRAYVIKRVRLDLYGTPCTYYLLTLLPECTEYSDCPNGGQNYDCISNVCTCVPGYDFVGDACKGIYYPIDVFYHCETKAVKF